MRDFDFLDIGCSAGGSLAWGKKFIGGRGLGIDIDPVKVAKAKAAGQEAILADATKSYAITGDEVASKCYKRLSESIRLSMGGLF